LLERPGNVDVASPLGERCTANSGIDAGVQAQFESVDGDAIADTGTHADAGADRHDAVHASADRDAKVDASTDGHPDPAACGEPAHPSRLTGESRGRVDLRYGRSRG